MLSKVLSGWGVLVSARQQIKKPLYLNTDAVMSGDQKYRYSLQRTWAEDDSKLCAFIGLNPSTADQNTDDPTIRRCVRFAQDWGYESLVMLNLFAWRDTDPKAMMVQNNPVGAFNDQMLTYWAQRAELVVCAWGNHGVHKKRSDSVVGLLKGIELKCFKITKAGQPIHPLYQRADALPVPYRLLS